MVSLRVLNEVLVLNKLLTDVVLNALDMESLAASAPFDPLPLHLSLTVRLLRPYPREPVVDLNHLVVTHIHVQVQSFAPNDDLIHGGVFFFAADFTGSAVVWSLVWIALA